MHPNPPGYCLMTEKQNTDKICQVELTNKGAENKKFNSIK